MVDIRKRRLLVPDKDNDVEALLTGSDSKYTAIPFLQTEMRFTLVKARLEQHDVVMLVDSGAQQVVLDISVVTDDFGFDLENHPRAKLVGHDGTETPMKVILNKTIKIGSAAIDGDFLVTDFAALKQAIGSKNGTFIGILGLTSGVLDSGIAAKNSLGAANDAYHLQMAINEYGEARVHRKATELLLDKNKDSDMTYSDASTEISIRIKGTFEATQGNRLFQEARDELNSGETPEAKPQPSGIPI